MALDLESSFQALGGRLSQPDRGLYLAPIRHHSPACAHAVRAMIREVKPAKVVIEAPVDYEPRIPLLLDPDTRPPVALVSLVGDGKASRRVAAYFPICAHSPEFVAMQEARAIGATIRFMDLSSSDKAMRRGEAPEGPLALTDERHFDSNAYVAQLCTLTGCRDGFELWDHLFEARLGEADWRGFFADVGVYCAGLRAATEEAEIERTGDAAREAQMCAVVAEALKTGGPVVVVAGGFHVPALCDPGDDTKPQRPAPGEDSYLIRYGFQALDALNGYAAGLPQPGYYDRLWHVQGDADSARHALAHDLMSDFAAAMRRDGHEFPVPAQVEALRVATSLAQLRGHGAPGRHDLFDGIRAALVKGESSALEVWTRRFSDFLSGTALGDIPAHAGAPPLVEDIRARARNLRIDVSDSAERRRKLDLRRKPAHLAASRLFHAMTLLGTGFARREIGPDFITRSRTDLLFEEWTYAWSPTVEGQLTALAIHGDDLPTACVGFLFAERQRLYDDGKGHDLPRLTEMLLRGILAGLGTELTGFTSELARDIEDHAGFAAVAEALRLLIAIDSATGPLAAPKALDIPALIAPSYRRLVYLCDDLPTTPADEITARLDALRMVSDILRGSGHGLDAELFTAAMDRIARAETPPEILGAALAIGHLSGTQDDATLATAIDGQFRGAYPDPRARIGMLRGILRIHPALLWRTEGLLPALNAFVAGLSEEDFLTLLPHLRLALTALNPRETDRLAEWVADLLGGSAMALTTTTEASEADLARALNIEARLRDSLAADGLTGWLEGA